jgi:uncharacterized protein
MKYVVKWIAWILVIIGALNWGLIGFFNFDLVAAVFGVGSMMSNIVYDLVGLSAVVLIIFKCFKHKMKKK